jgi:hypothetical protein
VGTRQHFDTLSDQADGSTSTRSVTRQKEKKTSAEKGVIKADLVRYPLFQQPAMALQRRSTGTSLQLERKRGCKSGFGMTPGLLKNSQAAIGFLM